LEYAVSVTYKQEKRWISMRSYNIIPSLAASDFQLKLILKFWNICHILAWIQTSVQASFESTFYEPCLYKELRGAVFFLRG